MFFAGIGIINSKKKTWGQVTIIGALLFAAAAYGAPSIHEEPGRAWLRQFLTVILPIAMASVFGLLAIKFPQRIIGKFSKIATIVILGFYSIMIPLALYIHFFSR